MRTRLPVCLALVLVFTLPALAEEEEPATPALELPLPRALREAQGGYWGGAVEPSAGWLGAHQCADGHWSAADFGKWCRGIEIHPLEPLPGAGEARQDVAVTSLALLAYLGAGYTNRGRHRHNRSVSLGARWLKRQQAESGRIGPADPLGGLRAHALATLALTELFGMTGSPIFREPAERALTYLLDRQQENGAWPREDGSGEDDRLATILAMFPVKSVALINEDARRHEESPPFALDTEAPLNRIRDYFDAQSEDATDLVVRATSLLARVFAGADPRRDPAVQAAAKHLAKHPPSPYGTEPEGDLLYIWIGTLGMFQTGGLPWKVWNQSLKTSVIDGQRRDGSVCGLHGSWDPHGAWVRSLGRVGATALAAMSLEVYYRYDKVFGGGGGGRKVPASRRVEPGTWRPSSLPAHAARFSDGRGQPLPIEAARVAAEIHGVRARVVLDLWVRNPYDLQREGRLELRLPTGAAPYYLAFGATELEQAIAFRPVEAVSTALPALEARASGEWGAVKEARMAPTAGAERAYREIVRKRRDPALLTWAGAGVFDLGIFPLEPGKLHRVVLGYETDLQAVGDAYQLDLDLPADVPDVAAALEVEGANVVAASAGASVTDGVHEWRNPSERSLRVVVRPPGDVRLVGPDAAGRDHVAMWVRPPVEALPGTRPSSRGIILLDASASGKGGAFAIRTQLLESLLDTNRSELAHFAIGIFDTEVRWWRDGFIENTAGNVDALLAHLAALELGGATDLGRALTAAAALEGDAALFLLSDGVPTWGAVDRDRLLGAHGGRRPLYAYRTGLAGENAGVLDALAESTGGALVSVLGASDIPAAARAHRHGTWRITGLEIPGVQDLLAVGRPTTLHRGQQLRLVGRGRPEPGARLAIGLQHGEVRQTVHVALPPPIASAMAARAYGHAAVVELESLGHLYAKPSLAYASHYRVVRRSAALIMLETEKDYVDWGLTEVDHAVEVDAHPLRSLLPVEEPPAASEPTTERLRFEQLLAGLLQAEGGYVDVPPPLLTAIAAAPESAFARPPRGSPATARALDRNLGSQLDAEPGDLEARVAAALDAWDAGRPDEAYGLLEAGVALHREARVLPWLLARLAEASGKHDLTLVWFEVALGITAKRGPGDLVWIVARDYARFLAHVAAGRRPLALGDFATARVRSLARLRLATEANEVVLLVPSSSDHGLDLCVVDRAGRRHCRCYHEALEGAEFIGVSDEDDGPKMFVAPQSEEGAYRVEVVRHTDARPPPERGLPARAIRIRDWGRAAEKLEAILVKSPSTLTFVSDTNR